MEGAVVLKGGGLVLFGMVFIWLGIVGWKARRAEWVSIVEAAILKALGKEEPLPFTKFDRALAYIQPLLLLVFGPLMIVSGLGILGMLGE